MGLFPRVQRTELGRVALDRFRLELTRYCTNGTNDNLTKEVLLQFVRESDYRWFWQAGREAVRWRVRDWVSGNLAIVTPWFKEAEQLNPGFFAHPMDYFGNNDREEIRELCKDFDVLVKLGVTPPPRTTPPKEAEEEPALKQTHYPNPFNTLPEAVVKERPELEGMTREEAWLYDLKQLALGNAAWIHHIKSHLAKGVEAFEEQDDPCARLFSDWLLDCLEGIEEHNPVTILKRRYNAARGCIESDSTRDVREHFHKVATLSQRLVTYEPTAYRIPEPSPFIARQPESSDSRVSFTVRKPQNHVTSQAHGLPTGHAISSSSRTNTKDFGSTVNTQVCKDKPWTHQNNRHLPTPGPSNSNDASSSSSSTLSSTPEYTYIRSELAPKDTESSGKRPSPPQENRKRPHSHLAERDRSSTSYRPGYKDASESSGASPQKRHKPEVGVANRTSAGMRQWTPSYS